MARDRIRAMLSASRSEPPSAARYVNPRPARRRLMPLVWSLTYRRSASSAAATATEDPLSFASLLGTSITEAVFPRCPHRTRLRIHLTSGNRDSFLSGVLAEGD